MLLCNGVTEHKCPACLPVVCSAHLPFNKYNNQQLTENGFSGLGAW